MRLCNVDRANDLMARDGLDAIIAHNPLNQYYLSNYWGLFNTPGGYDGSYISLLPANNTSGAALVVPALELRRLETTGGTWMENIFSYFTDNDDVVESFADGTPKGKAYLGWQPADDASGDVYTELDKKWLVIVNRYGQQMSPNAFWALARAIKHAGLEGARIGVDDPRIGLWLNECGIHGIDAVYSPSFFNEIRLVKTPDELAIMETAANINEQALLKAAHSLREGITWAEVQKIYMADVASNGGRGVYVACGLGELPAGHVRRDEPVMFDGLSQYQRYHGDFGRCAVVGEPSEKHKRYHRAICAGWDTAQELLKPGISYSELSVQVGISVRQAGIKDFRDPVVHGLGLEHTDDPKPYGVMPQTKPDQILQKNMVINVDLPHSEIGWGSVHLEDTVVITGDGFKRLSKASLDMVICS